MLQKIYKNIHYRQWNEGKKIIVLLHASPLSSVMFERFATIFNADYKLIAPDLPGYGNSATLPYPIKSVDDFLDTLHDFFHGIGLGKFILYGTATGCQIAIAYALRYPEDVLHLFGENACHFSDAERAEILPRYFPDATPRLDGSHLPLLWEMCLKTNVAFPWYEVADDDERLKNVPLQIVQMMFEATLRAGQHYDLAYRAAFAHERAEKVQSLQVSATFIIWSGSILKEYMERLAAFPMPENVEFKRVEGDIMARYEAVAALMSE